MCFSSSSCPNQNKPKYHMMLKEPVKRQEPSGVLGKVLAQVHTTYITLRYVHVTLQSSTTCPASWFKRISRFVSVKARAPHFSNEQSLTFESGLVFFWNRACVNQFVFWNNHCSSFMTLILFVVGRLCEEEAPSPSLPPALSGTSLWWVHHCLPQSEPQNGYSPKQLTFHRDIFGLYMRGIFSGYNLEKLRDMVFFLWIKWSTCHPTPRWAFWEN